MRKVQLSFKRLSDYARAIAISHQRYYVTLKSSTKTIVFACDGSYLTFVNNGAMR